MAVGGAASKAAQQATRTIPIVMSVVIDPVAGGLVSSLAHPGGNLTGTSMMASDLVGKQLGVLREVLPTVSRVALLENPANPGSAPQLREAEAVARALGWRLQTLEARNPQEIDSAFAAMTRERVGALVVLVDAIFTNQVRQIADLAAKRRLPSIYGQREYAEAGSLWSTAPTLSTWSGARRPSLTRFSRARSPLTCLSSSPASSTSSSISRPPRLFGLTLPSSLLLRADQVIE